MRRGRLVASRYEVQDRIGGGVMGAVFRAHDRTDDVLLALKLLRSRTGSPGELQRRFLREIQVSARLRHPNIVRVVDAGEAEGWLYIAMELLDGQDLRAVCARHEEVPLSDKLRIMLDVSAGLAYAHAQGVVHRDVKPSNIVVKTQGEAVLIDFGMARVSEGGDLTARGLIVGSPDYMSPEQGMGGAVDAHTDMFSAGSVFYELLSGAKPFQARTLHALLFQIISSDPVPLAQARPGLPEPLAETVGRMMAKAPGERFADMDAVQAALAEVARQLPGHADPDPRRGGGR